MGKPLSVLMVEDSEPDAMLMTRELKRAEFDLHWERVDTESAMRDALAARPWDVILSDYSMPRFDGLRALRVLQESGHDIPFIAVSGSIGEERAVALLKAGASDFILKSNFSRLAPAIERELGQAAVRRERNAGRARIRRQVGRLSALREIDLAIMSSLDLRVTAGVILDQVRQQLGVDAADLLLLNEAAGRLEFNHGVGFLTEAFRHAAAPLSQGHPGRAASERCLVHVPDLRLAEPDGQRLRHMAEEGFVAYFGTPLIAKGKVKGVLEVFHRSPLDPDEEWLEFLNALAGQAAIAIDGAEMFIGLEKSNADLRMAYDATLEGWVSALDLRDKETEGHSVRVADMTVRLALEAGVPDSEIIHIRRGALLHDVGKLGIPDSILLKQGALTPEEQEIMRRHPDYAHRWLSRIAYLRPALDIPYCHHEKWDGSGYPRGLRGEEIPLAARLFALADVWDALRSDRPYHLSWPEERARDHIRSESGRHFDPRLAEMFLRLSWDACAA